MEAWGQRGLVELEAEDRLAIACEKSPTQDPVISKLRDAFRVSSLTPISSPPPPPHHPHTPTTQYPVISKHRDAFRIGSKPCV